MNKYFLTEEQELIQEAARQFADEEVAPVTRELDIKHEFPVELVERCKELGFLGLPIPEEYGGTGADCVSGALVMEQLARHSSSLASIIDAHTSLGTTPLYLAGNEEQKEKYLKPAASGEKLCSFALTEPEAGSDSGATQTYAVLDGDEWVINGSKCWITNIGYSSIYTVAAKTDREAKGSRGISIFIVEAGTPGFEVGKPEEKMSNHSSYSGQIFFKDCRVPKENLLGELNGGFPLFMKCVDEGRIAISAVAVGMAQGVFERTVEYTKKRVAFGKTICSFQGVSFQLAEMATEIELARVFLYHVARLADAGLPYTKEAAMLKLFSSEMCVDVCNKGVQLHGGNGLSVEYEIERFYRDAKLLTIGEGTSEICKIVISGHVLR